jgi:hypothetical protein
LGTIGGLQLSSDYARRRFATSNAAALPRVFCLIKRLVKPHLSGRGERVMFRLLKNLLFLARCGDARPSAGGKTLAAKGSRYCQGEGHAGAVDERPADRG